MFVKIGARVLYTRADLDRFINQQRHKSTADHKAA
jgi:hypothetical protein